MDEKKITPFSTIYDSFFNHITDDMYMEWTKEDTYNDAQGILLSAIPRFEFPRVNLFDYSLGEIVDKTTINEETGEESTTREWVGGFFNCELSHEEINILAVSMVVEWLGRQLASTENIRMKYSGSDFKFTSQANHMAKIKVVMDKYEKECFHLQRLYKRRIVDKDGVIKSTIGQIMEVPGYGYRI